MTSNEWIKATIHCTSEEAEILSEAICSSGITGVEIDDQQDLFDFLDEYGEAWDYVDDSLTEDRNGDVTVSFYVSNDANGMNKIDELRATLNCEIQTDVLKEEDWANKWKSFFKPLELGEKVLICPEWEEIPENTGRTVFKVNPGMSFGTGMHQSTQMCITALEQAVFEGADVLDMGCGSGILFIIALLLGAGSAVAFDIDPNSITNAADNASLNDVASDKYKVLAGNILTDEKLIETVSEKKYDIVLANIVADVIIGLTPTVPALLKEDGYFITSGIVDCREEDVLKCLQENGFKVVERKSKDDWRAFVCKKAD